MPITLTISGDNANDILSELETLSRALAKPKIEWRQVTSAELDVRMAADIPEVVVADVTDNYGNSDPYHPPVEDKPKRKRRTKEEMEAERTFEEGVSETNLPTVEEALGAIAEHNKIEVVADILEDDTPIAAQKQVYTRASVQERVAKIISQRSLTPAEIRNVFITYGGESTNAASMDEKFAEAVATALDRAVAEKGA